MENTQKFMEALIRARAVRGKRGLPRLSNQERRSWWQFCLDMHEFLRGVIQHSSIDRDQGEQLARLQWIVLSGTYVFAKPDPELRSEQWRYIEFCLIVGAIFALIADDMEGIQNTFRDVFGKCRSASPEGPE